MNTVTRSLLCVGVAVASIGGGVIVSRALQSDDAPAAVSTTEFDSPVLLQGDPKAGKAQAIPMVAPVAVGDDPAIIDQLLEGPPDITPETPGPEVGRPGGDTPVIGVSTGPTPVIPDLDTAVPIDGEVPTTDPASTDPAATEPADGDRTLLDFPFYFDPSIGGVFWLPAIVFDTCAGATPGEPTPAGCPPGYAGTLGASGNLPPEPFMFGSPMHYTTVRDGDFPTVCPADTPAAGDGQTALTVFSETPLESLLVEWRPYGTDLVRQSLAIAPATLPDQASAWISRLDAEPYTRAAFGMIPRCFVIDRDPNQAYEVRLTAVDIYGREVTANRDFSLVDATPSGRPPTTAQVIGVQPIAQVEAWTTDRGSVRYTSSVVPAGTDPAELTCSSAYAVDTTLVHSVGGGRPNPVGIYDPIYTRRVVTTIDLPPGGQVLLCATIYDSINTLRPLATDTLLLQGGTAQRPVITLEGLRLNDGIRVPAYQLRANIQMPGELATVDDGCSGGWQNFDDISGSVTIDQPLWECTQAALPVDPTGYVKVPVTLTRRIDGPAEDATQSWGIQVQVDRCEPSCPRRPAEWFEIPIPSASLVLCGRSFWESDDGCPQPTDGVAIVKIEYPIIEGAAGRGTSTMIASTDRPVTDPTPGEPTVYLIDHSEPDGTDWLNLTSALSIISDRPVTISNIRLDDGIGGAGAGCAARDFPVSLPAATEFEIDVQVCAGTGMRATARVTDAAGVSYDKHLGFLFAPRATMPALSTTIEFLGGDDIPNFGWIYQFEVFLDGQTPSAYGWYNWSGPGAIRSCMPLNGTTATNYGGAPSIHVDGGSLEVYLRMNITTGGDTGCSGSGSDGLGIIEFSGSFTMAQIQSGGPMVLTTPPDARIQMRITLTPNATWRLEG